MCAGWRRFAPWRPSGLYDLEKLRSPASITKAVQPFRSRVLRTDGYSEHSPPTGSYLDDSRNIANSDRRRGDMARNRKDGPSIGVTGQAEHPWRKRSAIAVAIIFVVLLIAVVIAGTLNDPIRGIPVGTEEIPVDLPTHVEGKIYEDHQVPAGGAHSANWANCGFYSEPMPAEFAVHSLEHGAVWIVYQPGLPADQLDVLNRLAKPADKVLVSPSETQQSPITLTAWGNRLALDSTNDPRLAQFVAEFGGSFNVPEPGGPCTGGVGVPD